MQLVVVLQLDHHRRCTTRHEQHRTKHQLPSTRNTESTPPYQPHPQCGTCWVQRQRVVPATTHSRHRNTYTMKIPQSETVRNTNTSRSPLSRQERESGTQEGARGCQAPGPKGLIRDQQARAWLRRGECPWVQSREPHSTSHNVHRPACP